MSACMRLTNREHEVLRLLSHNLSTHQMASELWLSENTVKTHIRHVLDKLGVHSRHDAARFYWHLSDEPGDQSGLRRPLGEPGTGRAWNERAG